MEMTEEYFNRMTDEEKAEYLNKMNEISDSLAAMGDSLAALGDSIQKSADQIQTAFDGIEEAANAASGKKRVGTGIRSKAPRNIASRKPVKR